MRWIVVDVWKEDSLRVLRFDVFSKGQPESHGWCAAGNLPRTSISVPTRSYLEVERAVDSILLCTAVFVSLAWSGEGG
jgi:hypothetical protein